MEMDLSEDDQMMQAIAMSLGENVLVSTEQVCIGLARTQRPQHHSRHPAAFSIH